MVWRKEWSVPCIGLNVRAYGAAQFDHPLVDDAVDDLKAMTPASKNTGVAQHFQVLRHIWLAGIDVVEQIVHALFAISQSTDDLEPHRR